MVSWIELRKYVMPLLMPRRLCDSLDSVVHIYIKVSALIVYVTEYNSTVTVKAHLVWLDINFMSNEIRHLYS